VKRAVVTLRPLLLAVGIEGAFLLAGTVLLAAAASYISPAAALVVVGVACILAGIVWIWIRSTPRKNRRV
jgi:hypothetical protein